jgi:drug/metabolite transporter (DMT)-like permease
LLGIIAVSTASIFIRFAQEEVSSLVIAAYRLGIAAVLLSPLTLFKYQQELRTLSNSDFRLGVLSGMFLAVHFATWITSLEYTTVTSSVVLVTTTPIWVAILSPFTLKEKISKEIVVGLCMALTGTVVIAVGDACLTKDVFLCPPFSEFVQGKAFFGDFLALVGAWCAAGYVLIGRGIRGRLSLVPYVFVVYGIAAIVLAGMVVFSREQISGFSFSSYIWLFLLALVPQLIGHSTINWALGLLPAAYVAVTLLGEPVGSSILAAIFLKEAPGMVQVLGAILIFVGIIVASKPDIITRPDEE